MSPTGNPNAIALHPEARSAAAFAIVVGLAILAIWLWLISTGRVPELALHPWLTWFHIVADVLTAAVLLAAGWALIGGKSWARKIYLLAVGMTLLGALRNIGHYAERGDTGLAILFLILAVFCIVFVIRAER